MPVIPIPGRALVTVSGPEAEHFLQNIVTTDVEGLPAGELRAGALLSPQGKILFDFLLYRADGDAFRLDCRTEVASDLGRRLTLYRLRAKVEIAVQGEVEVHAGWNEPDPAPAAGPGLRDTRFPMEAAVRRSYGPMTGNGGAAQWDALRVRYGVAESGADFALGDAFPHDVLLDQNGGVAFRKGCFVGQEVVSRMQHRGTARRRILVAHSDTPLPSPGTEILAGGRAIGSLGTVVDRSALALTRIDRVADALAVGTPLEAGGVTLALAIPPGMRFSLIPASAEPVSPE